MANQLICDLCGGKIVMRAGGVGVCENCSMEYSLESLREKMCQPQQSAISDKQMGKGSCRRQGCEPAPNQRTA